MLSTSLGVHLMKDVLWKIVLAYHKKLKEFITQFSSEVSHKIGNVSLTLFHVVLTNNTFC